MLSDPSVAREKRKLDSGYVKISASLYTVILGYYQFSYI